MNSSPVALVVPKYSLLDPARGLAALAVVFFHRGMLPIFFHPVDWGVRYGEVGANIFFVISGYVIFQSMERRSGEGARGCWTFLKKRFRRIYPPFWASLIISFALVILLFAQRYSLLDYVSMLTLTFMLVGGQGPQPIYWTLAYEEQFYAVMTVLIVPVFNRISVPLVLLTTPIAIAHNLGLLSNWFVNTTVVGHWFEFELGILVYFILQRKVSRYISLPVFAALLVSGFMVNYRTIAPSLFAVFILACYPLDAAIHRVKYLAPVRWLGLISYSLYLMHVPGFLINDWAFTRLHIDHEYLKYFAGIAAALIASIGFFRLFEKPFLSASQKRELEPVALDAPAMA